MDSGMATRNPQNVGVNLKECTEFQLHMNQVALFDGSRDKIVDFTEKKLLKIINETNAYDSLPYVDMLRSYRDGTVAIAWNNGKPCFIRVTREK